MASLIDDEDEGEFLTGRLLVAMPGIEDPRFERAVLYLCAHDEEQAMGLAVNRPVEGLTVFELLERLGVKSDIQAPSDLVLLGGMIAAAPMGDPNASIPTPQPVHYRPMFAGLGRAAARTSATFVSKAAVENGLRERIGVEKDLLAVENTRGGLSKASMIHNSALPHIEVDPETYEVRADGEPLTCEPATVLPR